MRDALGAFADGAILFPLIAAISLQGALSIDRLLLTAGIAYIVTGYFFKIPMSVQPLKSIAIAAVAVHASGLEIRMSGAILGLICLATAYLLKYEGIKNLVNSIPRFFVQAMQTALGFLLIAQGFKILFPLSLFEKAASAFVLLAITLLTSIPLLGIFATLGLFYGVATSWFFANPGLGGSLSSAREQASLRPGLVAILVIPQIALTFANSVISTRIVAQRYFGIRALKVTDTNLLRTIGFGNLFSALIGGLPFCHGAGGLTAHYRGGSRTYLSNVIIGAVLVAFACVTHYSGTFALPYPLFLLSSLLISIGIFHLELAEIKQLLFTDLRFLIVAVITIFTQGMIWPLATATFLSLPYISSLFSLDSQKRISR